MLFDYTKGLDNREVFKRRNTRLAGRVFLPILKIAWSAALKELGLCRCLTIQKTVLKNAPKNLRFRGR
jgi:hypothetical protein